jgi:hypothetical protein
MELGGRALSEADDTVINKGSGRAAVMMERPLKEDLMSTANQNRLIDAGECKVRQALMLATWSLSLDYAVLTWRTGASCVVHQRASNTGSQGNPSRRRRDFHFHGLGRQTLDPALPLLSPSLHHIDISHYLDIS